MAKKPAKVAKKAVKKMAPKKAAKPMKKAAPAKKEAAKSSSASATAKARAASKPRNTSTYSYTQSEFVENIRAFCGLAKRSQAKEVIEDIAAFVTESLRKGYKIPLMGLGKLYVRETKPRTGRNPATGEIIQIPKRKRVRFTPAKALKEQVL